MESPPSRGARPVDSSSPSREVEDEYLGVPGRAQLEAGLLAGGGAVALAERGAVQLDAAASHLDPGVAAGGDSEADARPRGELRREDGRVLLDGHGAVAPVARGDEPQPPAELVGPEGLLLVARLRPLALREEPDLEEMDGLGLRVVPLAVGHPGSGAHPLHVAGADD